MTQAPIYAIGDIHGQLDALIVAHELIADDQAREGLCGTMSVHVGDLPDRGPNTAGVISYFIQGRARGENWLVLSGNHDAMFTGFLKDPFQHDPCLRTDLEWRHPRLGGDTTLLSYGVEEGATRPIAEVHADALQAVPSAHVDFLRGLPLSFHTPELFFVHAGIDGNMPLERQTKADLLWIRKPFHRDERDHGPLIVHGHTPVSNVTHYKNRVNIDTGGAYGKPLGVIVIEGQRVFQLTKTGRCPLRPPA